MSADINELRDHLFATLRGLRDKDNPMDLDRARTISNVAGALIDTARVEVEFLKVTGGTGTGFIEADKPDALPPGIVSVTRHRIAG